MYEKPKGAGKSSFDLIDAEVLFSALRIGVGTTLLDLGCGQGNYTLAAWERLGETGRIYAVDLWKEGIEYLQSLVQERNIQSIRPVLADASKTLPLEDESIDVCLLGTVFHDLVHAGVQEGALHEICRVLKNGGKLALVEFKPVDGPPGPPLHIRIAPTELVNHVKPFGFVLDTTIDLGPHVYVSIFSLIR